MRDLMGGLRPAGGEITGKGLSGEDGRRYETRKTNFNAEKKSSANLRVSPRPLRLMIYAFPPSSDFGATSAVKLRVHSAVAEASISAKGRVAQIIFCLLIERLAVGFV